MSKTSRATPTAPWLEVPMNGWARYDLLLLGVMFLFTGSRIQAQEKEKTVKTAPIQNTSPASGQEMFQSYCAVCHGKDAKGAGPASEALKTTPDYPRQAARRKVSRGLSEQRSAKWHQGERT